MTHATEIPFDSRVRASLSTANFHDSFELVIEHGETSALAIYLKIVSHTPAWINFLMTLRNRSVAVFGLKDLGSLGDIGNKREASSYKTGDRVGIFSILSLSDQEVVLVDNDKHLKAQVSIYKYAGKPEKFAVTTVVHSHNFLGQAYLFFVVPLHKIIVPAMMRRGMRNIPQITQ